jgi:hypothetical protein
MEIPLNSLQKGLRILQNQVQSRKLRIEAHLKGNKVLTESDEEWLDGEGNLVDEERVVQDLEGASDYERELGRLDIKDQGIVKKLQTLGDSDRVMSKKRNRMKNFVPCLVLADLCPIKQARKSRWPQIRVRCQGLQKSHSPSSPKKKMPP